MTSSIRWSQVELDAHRARRAAAGRPVSPAPAAAKTSKYASQKVEHGGEKFDSKKEARRWAELERMAAAGQITDLRRQVAFVLAPAVLLAGEARKKPAIRYWADFVYLIGGVLTVEDCKSAPTRKLPAYRLKRHLMKTVLGLDIKET